MPCIIRKNVENLVWVGVNVSGKGGHHVSSTVKLDQLENHVIFWKKKKSISSLLDLLHSCLLMHW